MSETIEAAIRLVIAKLSEKPTADEALKLSQAALNLAHTASVLRLTPT